ncbi:MAG: hypothetical protein QXY45_04045 [Candidatus Aenigmatarchaeota archaeon]
MKRWFCLDCKREVEVYPELLRGFSPTCRRCMGTRLMTLEDVDEKEFKQLVKDFKKKTGEV